MCTHWQTPPHRQKHTFVLAVHHIMTTTWCLKYLSWTNEVCESTSVIGMQFLCLLFCYLCCLGLVIFFHLLLTFHQNLRYITVLVFKTKILSCSWWKSLTCIHTCQANMLCVYYTVSPLPFLCFVLLFFVRLAHSTFVPVASRGTATTKVNNYFFHKRWLYERLQ